MIQQHTFFYYFFPTCISIRLRSFLLYLFYLLFNYYIFFNLFFLFWFNLCLLMSLDFKDNFFFLRLDFKDSLFFWLSLGLLLFWDLSKLRYYPKYAYSSVMHDICYVCSSTVNVCRQSMQINLFGLPNLKPWTSFYFFFRVPLQ